jgi:hypothetical protein
MVLERTPICWRTVAETLRTSVSASRWTHHLIPLSNGFKQPPTGNMQSVLKKFNVALQTKFHIQRFNCFCMARLFFSILQSCIFTHLTEVCLCNGTAVSRNTAWCGVERPSIGLEACGALKWNLFLSSRQLGENTISQDEYDKIFKYILLTYVIVLILTTYFSVSIFFWHRWRGVFFLKTARVAEIVPLLRHSIRLTE